MITAFAFYFTLLEKRIARRSHHILMASLAFLVVFQSIIDVNRNPIYGLVLLFAYVLILSGVVRIRSMFVMRNLKWAGLAAVLGAAIVSYFLFIASKRAGLQDVSMSERVHQSARYDMTALPLDESTVFALNSLSFYVSHQIPTVEQHVVHNPPVKFSPMILNEFVGMRIGRIYPEFGEWVFDSLYGSFFAAGIPIYTWPSIHGHVIQAFGWIGGPVFLGLLAYGFGRGVGRCRLSESVSLRIICLCFFSIFIFTHIKFNMEHHITLSLGYASLVFLLERSRLRNNG
jgi:hypothetical protein